MFQLLIPDPPVHAYGPLLYVHLATIIPAVFLGLAVFVMRKGTQWHRRIGYVYLTCMMITGIVTLFMPAFVGAKLWNHFGFIHLFSLLTIWTVPRAIINARAGRIRAHKGNMIGLYIGAVIIAGVFTFMPGRYMHSVFFS